MEHHGAALEHNKQNRARFVLRGKGNKEMKTKKGNLETFLI